MEKRKNDRKLELLAPAQNLKTGISAINYGADAVYIGANSFGARKMAGNNLQDIEELVNFAHKFNVKIYVTVNTILDDNELKMAQELIFKLYEIGVDAIIIQDMGILELELPKIELHASTQCNIRTLEKVKFFEKIGIKRAILARELSIDSIKEISKNTNIELETFIHGALCVSYSGNCYMSAYLGGRSSNRGECAQSCRMKYSLLSSNKTIVKDKHLLSLKDFCAEKYIYDLVSCGVKSFKIEGRLKDENYVKNVVLYYRRILDKFEKTSNGLIISDFEPDINKTFNRGYTTYFLGHEKEIFNFDTPKSMGEYIGTITDLGKNYFKIKTDKILSPQDGLCFIENGEMKGCLVNKIEGDKVFPNKKMNLKKGLKIFRNEDVAFENLLKNSKTKRFIEAKLTVKPTEFVLSDGIFQVSIPNEGEYANNQEKMIESIEKAFKKTGDGIFLVKEICFETSNLFYMPISRLNAIRRELFSSLENLRLKNYKREEFHKTVYEKYLETPVDYRLNVHNDLAKEFYKKCGVEISEFSVEKTGDYKNKELMRTKHCIRRALNICLKNGAKNEQLFLLNKDEKKFPLKFDCKNCEMAILAP